MRRAGPPLSHHAHDLLQLLAQTLIGVEPTGRIDEHGVDAPRRGRLDSIERDRGRITPLRCAYERRAEEVGPDFELLGGARAECVGGRQQYAPAFGLEPLRELRDRRRLPCAVDAKYQNHRRGLRRTRQRRRRRTKLQGDDALEARLIDRIGTTQALDGVVRRGNAEVRFDQHALHFFKRDGVHRAAGEEATDLFPQAHHGSPWRRRNAHSVANARVAMTNSHQRSRRPMDATRAVASPGCAVSAGTRGSHSSE